MKFFFAPLLFLVSCLAVLEPASGPGTPYPCGISGVSCGNHECCPEYHVCGGTPFSGCPAGECCFTGDGMRAPDAGAPMTPQRPE
jgi:hypothetical protein